MKKPRRPRIRSVKTAREAAASALWRVYADGAYSHLALDAVLRQSSLSREARKSASAIFYGSLQEHFSLSEEIETLTNKSLKKLDLAVVVLLRSALWQLHYSRQAEHAVVNEAVRLTKRWGFASAAGLVNAVLRRAQREGADAFRQSKEARTGFCSSLYELFFHVLNSHEEVLRLGDAFRENHGSFLRFRRGFEPEALKKELAREGAIKPGFFQTDGVYFKSGGRALTDLPAYRRGAVIPQGEAAMLPVQILAPDAEDLLFDFCAAPGGKTLQMSEYLSGGRITAGELHAKRCRQMQEQLKAFGADDKVNVICHDAAAPWPETEKADKILADVPCSGLGLIGSKPELSWHFEPEKIRKNLLPVQAGILDQAAAALKPGGLLMYSTCTLNPEENEKQAERFLADHPEFSAEPFGKRAADVTDKIRAPDPESGETMAQGFLTLWPQRVSSEGFFLALFRKRT
mgnify:CR=1 FL=1